MGNGVASAAIEAFSRILAGELGPSGIRSSACAQMRSPMR
jgi:enoyl-[acyl-carrier-protein] reductase (NADH)